MSKNRRLFSILLFNIASLAFTMCAPLSAQDDIAICLPKTLRDSFEAKRMMSALIELPLYYWRQQSFTNFGDVLSLKLLERITQKPIRVYSRKPNYTEKKLLAIGSILSFATDHDVIWGTGVNGKLLAKKHYLFRNLDVRAVRGPLTREFLTELCGVACPEVYGDPALLMPYFFPEFQRSESPEFDYIVIPHYSEAQHFPKERFGYVVYPTEPWDAVVQKICNAKFVISSSLHGVIVAEAYGIPARLLRITQNEPIFKYCDYYYGTNRYDFRCATSVEEALQMGGERPFECDLAQLYAAFPFEFFPGAPFLTLNLPKSGTYAIAENTNQ